MLGCFGITICTLDLYIQCYGYYFKQQIKFHTKIFFDFFIALVLLSCLMTDQLRVPRSGSLTINDFGKFSLPITLQPQLTSKVYEIILSSNKRELCQNSDSVQFLKIICLKYISYTL